MTNKDQIKSMYGKLCEMEEFLGGHESKKRRGATEFEMMKNEFLEIRHQTDKLLDRKQDPSTPQNEMGKLTFKIREGINKMQDLLGSLEDDIRRTAKKQKTSDEIISKQQKILENCKLLLQDINNRNSGYAGRTQPKVQTLTDMKAKLLKDIDATSNQIEQMGAQEEVLIEEDDEEQIDAIKEFKQVDQQIENKLDGIIQGVDKLKRHAQNINAANDVIKEKVENNKKAVGKLSEKIQSENQKLKEIIKKFKPNNCCLWLVMFLMLGGLVVVIINFTRSK